VVNIDADGFSIFSSYLVHIPAISPFIPLMLPNDLHREHQTSPSGIWRCLVAKRNPYGNGKYGGLADIYQYSEHGARPTRTQNLRPPGVTNRQRRAHARSPSHQTQSRARRGPRILHPGRLGQRGVMDRLRCGGCGRISDGCTKPLCSLAWLAELSTDLCNADGEVVSESTLK
jgi:hypothetical protein